MIYNECKRRPAIYLEIGLHLYAGQVLIDSVEFTNTIIYKEYKGWPTIGSPI